MFPVLINPRGSRNETSSVRPTWNELIASATELALALEKLGAEPFGAPTTPLVLWPLTAVSTGAAPLATSDFAAAAEAGFEKSFAQLEGGALAAGAGSVAADSDSAGFSEDSDTVTSSGALSVATSPLAGFSASTGLASLVLALGRDGRAGTGTAEVRAAGRFVAVEVALVAVLVRDRC